MQLRRFVANGRILGNSGFTLIEGVVGIGVMGMLIVCLYTGMTTGFSTVRLARENLRATQVIQEKFETIRLYTWDQINDPNFVPASFTASFYNGNGQTNQAAYNGTVKITKAGIADAYADDLRLVTIQVNWTSGVIARSRTMSSFVARYGLQNYIY